MGSRQVLDKSRAPLRNAGFGENRIVRKNFSKCLTLQCPGLSHPRPRMQSYRPQLGLQWGLVNCGVPAFRDPPAVTTNDPASHFPTVRLEGPTALTGLDLSPTAITRLCFLGPFHLKSSKEDCHGAAPRKSAFFDHSGLCIFGFLPRSWCLSLRLAK